MWWTRPTSPPPLRPQPPPSYCSGHFACFPLNYYYTSPIRNCRPAINKLSLHIKVSYNSRAAFSFRFPFPQWNAASGRFRFIWWTALRLPLSGGRGDSFRCWYTTFLQQSLRKKIEVGRCPPLLKFGSIYLEELFKNWKYAGFDGYPYLAAEFRRDHTEPRSCSNLVLLQRRPAHFLQRLFSHASRFTHLCSENKAGRF